MGDSSAKMKNHFTILIPSYNVEKWVSNNLGSCVNQDYDNYDIVYIDDFSSDQTWSEVNKFDQPNLYKYRNSFNKGKMENLYQYIKDLRDDTIIVILDGDDWLFDNNVLSKLNDIYNSGDVWMTNGSYLIARSDYVVRPNISDDYWDGNIRGKSWEFSHLGSFKKKLFDKIKRKHLMNKQGQFWATTSDQAIMWPMVEMCGPKHHKAVNDVLYVYNRHNPLSDDRVHREDQLLTEKIIRSIEPYKRLQEL